MQHRQLLTFPPALRRGAQEHVAGSLRTALRDIDRRQPERTWDERQHTPVHAPTSRCDNRA